MKSYLMVVCAWVIAINSYSSNLKTDTDVIPIKGYICKIVSQKDIRDSYDMKYYRNKAIRQKKDFSHKINYCTFERNIFVPIEINNKKIDFDIRLYDTPYYSLLDTSYITPENYQYGDGLRFILNSPNDTIDLDREKSILNAAFSFCPYYEYDSERFIRIMYVEGYATKITKTQNNQLRINSLFGDTYKNARVFYLITKISYYSTIINLPGFNVWYPYLDK